MYEFFLFIYFIHSAGYKRHYRCFYCTIARFQSCVGACNAQSESRKCLNGLKNNCLFHPGSETLALSKQLHFLKKSDARGLHRCKNADEFQITKTKSD